MRPLSPHAAVSALGLLTVVLSTGRAEAFTTRVHIAIANEIRESLVAGDGRTIALKAPLHGTQYRVQLSEADATAVIRAPLAFRAGAVGPDNMAFPAMTDPSHALNQRPFLQCELLAKSAASDEERAYAIGCFLHGATDIVAHHFVNYLTGETFTLNPISSARQQSFDNVIAHIQAERLFQTALVKARPAVFGQDQLAHVTPQSFVARNYFNAKSPLYPVFAGHAEGKLRAAMAGKSLLAAAATAGLGPADHLSLAAIYLAEIDALRAAVRSNVESGVKLLQDRTTTEGATLRVTAGPDGKLGTKDDATACSASCATIYARYFVSVGLLAPRQDAGGGALPSAFDKVSEKLGDDLREFVPAYLTAADRFSAKFNTPMTAAMSGSFDLDATDVPILFDPLVQWGTRLTTIDYRTLTQAVVPGWIISIENALQSVGVNVSVPDLAKALLDPVIQPIRDMLKARVIDEAKKYVDDLTAAYRAKGPGDKVRFEAAIAAAAGANQPGTMLDNVVDSGVYAHAYNLAVATLANHEVVLPLDPSNATTDGPASFDTSYSLSWTQAGLCDHLRDAVFPFGLGAKALLSVEDAKNRGTKFEAQIADDSPIECHGGSLSSFSNPASTEQCKLTELGPLLVSRTGSISRGFPPELGPAPVSCRGVIVAGLPLPKATNDGGASQVGSAPPGDGGCGCSVNAPGGSGALASELGLGAIAYLSLRRRKRTAKGKGGRP